MSFTHSPFSQLWRRLTNKSPKLKSTLPNALQPLLNTINRLGPSFTGGWIPDSCQRSRCTPEVSTTCLSFICPSLDWPKTSPYLFQQLLSFGTWLSTLIMVHTWTLVSSASSLGRLLDILWSDATVALPLSLLLLLQSSAKTASQVSSVNRTGIRVESPGRLSLTLLLPLSHKSCHYRWIQRQTGSSVLRYRPLLCRCRFDQDRWRRT